MNYTREMLDKLGPTLLGHKIVKIEFLSAADTKEMCWGQRPLVLTLDNGVQLMPQSDEEGNDGGTLATNIRGCEIVAPDRL